MQKLIYSYLQINIKKSHCLLIFITIMFIIYVWLLFKKKKKLVKSNGLLLISLGTFDHKHTIIIFVVVRDLHIVVFIPVQTPLAVVEDRVAPVG